VALGACMDGWMRGEEEERGGFKNMRIHTHDVFCLFFCLAGIGMGVACGKYDIHIVLCMHTCIPAFPPFWVLFAKQTMWLLWSGSSICRVCWWDESLGDAVVPGE
jgi:hypothetical protein